MSAWPRVAEHAVFTRSSPVVLFYQIPKPGPVLSGSRGLRSRVSIKVVGRVLGVCRCEEAMAAEINL